MYIKNFIGDKSQLIQMATTIFAISAIISACLYFGWLSYHLNWNLWLIATLFLASELVHLIHMVLSILGNRKAHWPMRTKDDSSPFAPSVDVFITVCGEPLSLVKTTILKATKIDYQNKTIHILDDKGDRDLQVFCERHSLNYIHRSTHEHRKAGNLNHGLKLTSGDFILTLDADQNPSPDIIKDLISYFEDSNVAFVTTHQQFILPKNDPWGNADSLFYEVMQVSKFHDNAAISTGSGVIYRRKALQTVEGFNTWSIIEDLYTSMCLHAKKWSSVYLIKPYTLGIAPFDIITQYKQRYQWALDSMRIFFWDNPLFKKGLTLAQRYQYLEFGFHYLSFGLFLPFMFFLPLWALFSGKSIIISTTWLVYAIFRLQYALFVHLFHKVVSSGRSNLKTFQVQAGLFPIFFLAIWAALKTRKRLPAYTVTEKTAKNYSFFSRLKRVIFHVLAITASFVAIIYAYFYPHIDIWFNIINVIWALWVIITLSRITLLALWPNLLIHEKEFKIKENI